MAILRVAQMGHPVLRQPSQDVDPELLASPGFQQFLDDLLETMHDYDGAGLAAPQVHVLLRAVVLTLDDDRGPEFWINPVIEPLTDETHRSVEGCLSVAGIRGCVDRPNRIKVTYLDRTGEKRAYELRGFPAIVAQHECDHLDGVLYIDKVDTSTLAFLSEYRRFGRLDELMVEPSETWDDEDEGLTFQTPETTFENLVDIDEIVELEA